jgi:deazaflavin-dependent oxidoreductase (nitroreductase family)
MAHEYRLGFIRRAANLLVRGLLTLRVPLPHTYLLRVRGRQTGVLRTTPVRLVENGRDRFLVSPYGEVNWVRNARAADEIQLKRRSRWETARITELTPNDAAPILKTYITEVSIVRPFFDVTPRSSQAEFEREAPRHPVFRIIETTRAAA